MRILALDVGDRRVGVAISDPTGTLARPLETLVRREGGRDVEAIAGLVAEHGVELVVVGQPLTLSGVVGRQARSVARYVEELVDSLSVPVISWDERYTTVAAKGILRQTRGRQKRRRARASGELDAVAAAVILQSYLDSRRGGQS